MQKPDFSAIWSPNGRPLKLPDGDKFANKNSMRCVVVDFVRKLSGGPLQNGQRRKGQRASRGGETSAQVPPSTSVRFLSRAKCTRVSVGHPADRRVEGVGCFVFNVVVVLVSVRAFSLKVDDWRRTDGWVCLSPEGKMLSQGYRVLGDLDLRLKSGDGETLTKVKRDGLDRESPIRVVCRTGMDDSLNHGERGSYTET